MHWRQTVKYAPQSKTLFVALLVLAATSMLEVAPAEAGDYCLNPASGGSSCSFSSLEQCQETARGRNGWCSHVVDFGATRASDSLAYFPIPDNKHSSAARRLEGKISKDGVPAKGVGAE
jgi:hypothetical protein